jgi:hypothetical protein
LGLISSKRRTFSKKKSPPKVMSSPGEGGPTSLFPTFVLVLLVQED